MSTTEIPRLAVPRPPLDRNLSPVPHWHDAGATGHTVQFYSDDSFLLDSLSQFVGSVLVAGDIAIIIATREHRDGIGRCLFYRVVNVSKATLDGRYVALDAVEALSRVMHNDLPDPEAFAATIGSEIS